MTSSPFKVLTLAFVVALSGPSIASDAPAAAPISETAKTTHKVTESISVDRLVQKIYANSPLNTTTLRKALMNANPKVITGNPQQRLRSGTDIVVPDHGEIVRATLAPFVTVAQDQSENNPVARDNQVRKQWVRFP